MYKFTEENKPKEFIKEVQIDTDFEILFPSHQVFFNEARFPNLTFLKFTITM